MVEVKRKFYYRTRDVEEILKVSAATLRWWEREFRQLAPTRTQSGHRRYSENDIEVCRQIQQLMQVKGYSLTYAKRLMNAAYRKDNRSKPLRCTDIDTAMTYLEQAKALISNAHAVARIEAVERFLLTPENETSSPIFPQTA